MRQAICFLCSVVPITTALPGARVVADAPSYGRDVRPILAANCFPCHGPDARARKADLRLDTFAGATRTPDSPGDLPPVDPGRPATSAVFRRITSADPDHRMPPVESKKTLSEAEIEAVRRWIEAGAKYSRHWAFAAPVVPPVPPVERTAWPQNPIDRFVLHRLEAQGLAPSDAAGPYSLVRRVYLDLTGLPPTPEEADAFAADAAPDAYERLLDRLLASPDYGERWARPWLDLARYADTNGYEKDRRRSIWPYRDWVIQSLNADQPYDQFSVEQLAGDMLPEPTAQQRIATGFHRNTMLNEEGGVDPLEYRFYSMVDRVATTGTVWLGLTVGCAQCHSHKYDPITQAEYYELMALLNNAEEPDLLVPDPDIAARRAELDARIDALEAALPEQFPPLPGSPEGPESRARHLELKLAEWLERERTRAVRWSVMRPHHLATNLPRLEVLPDGSIFSSGDFTKRDVYTLRFRLGSSPGALENTIDGPLTALRLEVMPDSRLPAGGPGQAYYEGRKGDFFLSELTVKYNGESVRMVSPSHTYGKIAVGSGNANAANVLDGEGSTGWSTAGAPGRPHQLVVRFEEPLNVPCELEIGMLFERHFVAGLGRFRFAVTAATENLTATTMPVNLTALLARDPASWGPGDRAALRKRFLSVTPELAEARKPIDELRREMPEFPLTLVMRERAPKNPRKTHRHHRGEYLKPREEVAPGLPAVLSPAGAAPPRNRLELARWLVSRANPLAARTATNRAWQEFFGRGVVPTAGDLGTQGEPPSHPDLLDWLATELASSGWSLKRLHRLIAASAVYRQRSGVTPRLLQRDPENRWFARGPGFRVPAEVVRDIGLAASGLLTREIGGPSVFPPQPEVVTAQAYGGFQWQASTGKDRYRRSLYTFSKRTAPFAAYLTFDAPTGESCVSRRARSNTPLQALTTLNDEMFLEFAREVALVAVRDTSSSSGAGAADCAKAIFRRWMVRPPSKRELRALLAFYEHQFHRLEQGELDPEMIANVPGASPRDAAWVMVSRAVMNLDETITKR